MILNVRRLISKHALCDCTVRPNSHYFHHGE